MAFDVNQFREAHRPWSFTIGRRSFLSRHVSAPTVQRYEAMRVAAMGNARKQTGAIRWLLRHAFPWRFSYLVRGDPVRIILGLEHAAQIEALTDFFACLLGQTRETQQMTKTGGAPSPSRTPTPSA